MRCANCQHLNPEQAVACLRCGAFLAQPGPAVSTPEGPTPKGSPPEGPTHSASASGTTTFAPGETLLDRYRVELLLGEGGMSAVYQVLDLKLDRRAALKVLNEALLENWKAHERMKREANALARIHHPHVVEVRNVLEIRGALAIELELLTGGTVASRIAQRPYDAGEASAVMRQVLDGLTVIHSAGLIHRDLKPGNILLASDGTPKIADLGIARDPGAQLLTAPGTVLGTPDYMSPEQVRAVEVGPESDLYSCGILLFEMVTGHLPFDAQTEKQALAAHLNQPPNLAALPRDLPEAVRSTIARALEKRPEARFPDAQSMRDALSLEAPVVPHLAPQPITGAQPARPSSESGRIGEYLLQGLIGEGGMGRVYAAEERLSKRRVALKVMRHEVAASEAGRRLFMNEMAVLAQLDHPNVVRSLACAELDGQLVMALELLEGETLRRHLEARGPMRWDAAVDVVIQIASALDCAHSLATPIVHRDLKPENVMLMSDGSVKVMDFGIAKVLEAVHRTATLSIGTLQYMSPEQIDAQPVDGRSDLYSLGLLFYELLAGQPPFASPSQRELLNLQCTAPPPPLPESARGLPRGVERVLYQLLEKAPNARPQSAREVLDRLEPFASADPTNRASHTYSDGAYAPPPAPPAPQAPQAVSAQRAVAGAAPNVPQPSVGRAATPFGETAPSPAAPQPGAQPRGNHRRGIQVHPVVAIVVIGLLSLFAGLATFVVRVLVLFFDSAF